MRDVVFAHVDAVDLDEPLVIGVQALQQARDGGLAGAGAADHAEGPADGNLEGDAVEGVSERAVVFEADARELDMSLERSANAVSAAALFQRLLHESRHERHSGARLVELVDELRDLQQRPLHAIDEDHEGEEIADADGIVGGHRLVDADRQRARHRNLRQRPDPGLDHRRYMAGMKQGVIDAHGEHVPHGALARLQGQRLDRADAGEVLIQERAPRHFRGDDRARRATHGRQHHDEEQHHQAGYAEHDEGEQRAEGHHHRQHDEQGQSNRAPSRSPAR